MVCRPRVDCFTLEEYDNPGKGDSSRDSAMNVVRVFYSTPASLRALRDLVALGYGYAAPGPSSCELFPVFATP